MSIPEQIPLHLTPSPNGAGAGRLLAVAGGDREISADQKVNGGEAAKRAWENFGRQNPDEEVAEHTVGHEEVAAPGQKTVGFENRSTMRLSDYPVIGSIATGKRVRLLPSRNKR